MFKKALLVLLFTGSYSNNVHGFLGFGGGEPQDYLPYFNKKIADEITLDEAQRLLPVLKIFINENKKAKIEWDGRIISIIKSDTVEKESSPDMAYRNKIITRIEQAEANLEALEVQIRCYKESITPEEINPDEVDNQEDNTLDSRDDAEKDVREKEAEQDPVIVEESR